MIRASQKPEYMPNSAHARFSARVPAGKSDFDGKDAGAAGED
jgi:hypothetical protein